MTKKVYRYFLDATLGQEAWLNEMSKKGWRLISCGQLSYTFESCEPGAYEYAVEFVAHMSYTKSKDYKAFLESMGYRTLYKNINVGKKLGVNWRPWAEGRGQIATSPGSYQKELLIVEKKRDDKPFILHSDPSDQIETYRQNSRPYYFNAVMFGVGAETFVGLAIIFQSAYFLFGAIPFLLLAAVFIHPAVKLTKKRKLLEQETQMNEREPVRPKKIGVMIFAIALPFLLTGGILGGLYLADIPIQHGSVLTAVESSGSNYWDARYRSFKGVWYKRITLEAGSHTIRADITTDSGSLTFSAEGKEDVSYFTRTVSDSTELEYVVELDEKEKITLSMKGEKHTGSYHITWE
jgi:hypothetical protein